MITETLSAVRPFTTVPPENTVKLTLGGLFTVTGAMPAFCTAVNAAAGLVAVSFAASAAAVGIVVAAALVPPPVPASEAVVPPPPPPQPAKANATSPAAPIYIQRPQGRFM